jgi:hypothetical protein
VTEDFNEARSPHHSAMRDRWPGGEHHQSPSRDGSRASLCFALVAVKETFGLSLLAGW